MLTTLPGCPTSERVNEFYYKLHVSFGHLVVGEVRAREQHTYIHNGIYNLILCVTP